ncbi:hypothetical protein [Arcobacter vandammei]|uniref:hypothetical protein n=1 Tax=Arcobacter vandammei TaxID=2782243 RepID=UPI0018DF8298|nr:hypothetical protein [Arcobacter vandammei]
MKIIKYLAGIFFITLLFTSCVNKISKVKQENYTNPLIKDKNTEKLKFENDKLDCEIIAHEKVPNVYHGNSNSGSFTTTNTSTGTIYRGTYGDDNVNSLIFQSVQNSEIKLKYFEQCMRSRGWVKID